MSNRREHLNEKSWYILSKRNKRRSKRNEPGRIKNGKKI